MNLAKIMGIAKAPAQNSICNSANLLNFSSILYLCITYKVVMDGKADLINSATLQLKLRVSAPSTELSTLPAIDKNVKCE